MPAPQPARIRPLRDRVTLYVDDSDESREAEKLLRDAGISPNLSFGSTGPLERRPLLLYNGGSYQGVDEIRGLLNLLEFWSRQPWRKAPFLDPQETDRPA